MLLVGVIPLASLGFLAVAGLFGGYPGEGVLDQFHALGHLSLLHMVVIPGMPASLLMVRRREPTVWMKAAGVIWALGAVGLLVGWVQGSLETGWSFALASPMTRGLVGGPQLVALLLAALAAELFTLQVLDMHARPGSGDFQEAGPAVAARILALALPLQASSAFVGGVERLLGVSLLPGFMHPMLAAWSWTPIATGLLMMASSAAVATLAPGRRVPVGALPMAVGALSLAAIQLPLLPTLTGSFLPLCFSGLNALLAASAWTLGFRLLPSLVRRGEPWNMRRVWAVLSLALISTAPPIVLGANVLAAFWPPQVTPWLLLTHAGLAIPALLACMAAISPPPNAA